MTIAFDGFSRRHLPANIAARFGAAANTKSRAPKARLRLRENDKSRLESTSIEIVLPAGELAVKFVFRLASRARARPERYGPAQGS